MENEKIKALVKEAIEEDRKERVQAHIDHFGIGIAGAVFFFIFLGFAALFSFGFIGGMIFGIGIFLDFDIILILVVEAFNERKKQVNK